MVIPYNFVNRLHNLDACEARHVVVEDHQSEGVWVLTAVDEISNDLTAVRSVRYDCVIQF